MEIRVIVDDRLILFLRRALTRWQLLSLLILSAIVPMGIYADVPNVFESGTVISSSAVNENFTDLDERLATYEGAISVDLDTGNVGIGTTIPAGQLEIYSEEQDQSLVLGHNTIYQGTEGASMYMYTHGTGRLYIQNEGSGDVILAPYEDNGKLGIGTFSPAAKLDVNGNSLFAGHTVKIASDDGHGFLDLYATTEQTNALHLANANGYGQIGMVPAQPLVFLTDNTVRIWVNGNGETGIGTSETVAALHVEGGAAFGARFVVVAPEVASDHADAGVRGSIAWHLERLATTGGTIQLEPGVYPINNSLAIYSNITIRGTGPNSVIEMKSPHDGITIAQSDGIHYVSLENFWLKDVSGSSETIGVHFTGADEDRNSNIFLHGLMVTDWGEQGIHIKGTNELTISDLQLIGNGTQPAYDHNIYLRRCRNVNISNVFSYGAASHGFNGTELDEATISNFISRSNGCRGMRLAASNKIRIVNSNIVDPGRDLSASCNKSGIVLTTENDGANDNISIVGTSVSGSPDHGIEINSGNRYVISGCAIDDNEGYSVWEEYASNVLITGNIFTRNGTNEPHGGDMKANNIQ